MKHLTKQTFSMYLAHTKPYFGLLLLVIVAIIGASLVSTVTPLLYKDFFDTVFTAESPVVVKATLVHILMKIGALYLLGWILWRITEFTSSYIGTKILKDISQTCFSYLHRHSASFFNDQFIGSLVKKSNRFVWAYDRMFDILTYHFVGSSVILISILIVLGSKHFLLMLIMLTWFILFLLANFWFSKFKLKFDVERSELDSKVGALYADTLSNHVNVKLFNGMKREEERYDDITTKWQKKMLFSWNLASLGFALQAGLMIMLEIGIFYYAIILWEKGLFTIGDFALLQSYVILIFEKVWSFGRIIRDWYESLADAEEMTRIFETPHEIVDTKGAKDLVLSQGEITFDRVSFEYHKTRSIFKQFDHTFAAGKKYALVGPSGAGKSTIIKLILRQFDVSGGKVLIDGQDIKKVTQESLWQQISFVPQDPVLFHRSLLENIRYGRPDATNEEVIAAAKAAHCHEFIMNFPDTYETLVGERGVKLSGGERQRIAIARAILRDAPILILDEATSSLDSESEGLIQDALDKLMKGKTVIIIAHRLSTIMKMDTILVIEDGQIIESGSHKQLLQKKEGLYSKLWQLQAGGFIE